MKFALVQDGIVKNIVVGDENFANSIRSNWDDVVSIDGLTLRPRIGWAYDGETFSIPSKSVENLRESKLEEIRDIRSPKLAKVDLLCNLALLNSWTGSEKIELRDYRLALLNITEPYKADMSLLDDLDISDIEWPSEPEEQ